MTTVPFLDEPCPACWLQIGDARGCVPLDFDVLGDGIHHREPAKVACTACGAPAWGFHHLACPFEACPHGLWSMCERCDYFGGNGRLGLTARQMNDRWARSLVDEL